MPTPRSNADREPDAAEAFAERCEIASTASEIERIERMLLERLEACGYDAGAVFAVRLAFQEAANNARVHGNACDPDKRIRVRMSVEAQRVSIEIEDEGGGFDPATVPDPTLDENIEIPANASGLFEAAAADTGVEDRRGVSMPVMVEVYDGAGSGLGAGLLIGAMAAMICVAVVAVVGVTGSTPSLATSFAGNLWLWAGGLLGLTVIFGLVGLFLGKASE